MRRKHLLIGLAFLGFGAAAAFAILPQSGDDLRGNLPFVPTELWSLLGKERAPATTLPVPPQNRPRPPIHHIDPLADQDALETGKIYIADFPDNSADDPASEPTGGSSPPKGTEQHGSNRENTDGISTDSDLLGPLQGGNGDGYGGLHGGSGRFVTLTTSGDPTGSGEDADNAGGGSGDGRGGGGGGGGGEPSGGKAGFNNEDDAPNGNTGDTTGSDRQVVLDETPIAVDEPAPLFLLLIGGMALALVRRARR